MATKVNVPVADEDVDLSSPRDAITTIVMLVIGFVIFFVAMGLGQDYAGMVSDYLGNLLPGESSGGETIQVV